jgi:hypothetical protein
MKRATPWIVCGGGRRPHAENPENTLDFWADYAINPEDRIKLEATIEELPGKAKFFSATGDLAYAARFALRTSARQAHPRKAQQASRRALRYAKLCASI